MRYNKGDITRLASYADNSDCCASEAELFAVATALGIPKKKVELAETWRDVANMILTSTRLVARLVTLEKGSVSLEKSPVEIVEVDKPRNKLNSGCLRKLSAAGILYRRLRK